MARVGAIYNDAAFELIEIYQCGSKVIREDNTISTSGFIPEQHYALDLSSAVPPTARSVTGRAYSDSYYYTSFTPLPSKFIHISIENGWGSFQVMLIEEQQIYCYTGDPTPNVIVNGWEY